MKLKRLLVALGFVAGLAGAAFLAKETEGTGLRMVSAADKFLAGLDAQQKARATFTFDDKERTRWFFTPQQAKGKSLRKGLPLAEMTPAQKKLAQELVRTGTSEDGYKKATTIMSLESILAKLETKGRIVRDPEWYFFTVFGTPDKTGKWGWRVEGHHLSLNFTLDAGKVVSATPFMFGANPADVKSGARKGLRTLPGSEDHARALFQSLDADQKKLAHRDKGFKEIEEAKPKQTVGDPVGLPASKLQPKQRELLWKLIEGYAHRMPDEVAALELAAIKKAGLDKVHFAFGGGDGTPGKPYTYRVHGPTFLVEFLNEQSDSAGNRANHIHSAYRRAKGDFGLTTP
jgi:hypothetical protein